MTLLKNKFSTLSINNIALNLNLGWGAEERANKQTILVDVLLKFPNPPAACLNDELEDTFSYDPLIKNILKETTGREFKLIEHLGAIIYQMIRKSLPDTVAINVTIHKDLAVVNLPGTAVFQFGDIEAN